MESKRRQQELPPELRVFLAEIGEAVKEILETKHKESRKMQKSLKEGDEKNESSWILPGQ